MTKEVNFCGECPLFTNEDTDGYGLCSAVERESRCSDECAAVEFTLSVKGAFEVLKQYQQYRKAKTDDMLPVRLYSAAIDKAIAVLKDKIG